MVSVYLFPYRFSISGTLSAHHTRFGNTFPAETPACSQHTSATIEFTYLLFISPMIDNLTSIPIAFLSPPVLIEPLI